MIVLLRSVWEIEDDVFWMIEFLLSEKFMTFGGSSAYIIYDQRNKLVFPKGYSSTEDVLKILAKEVKNLIVKCMIWIYLRV